MTLWLAVAGAFFAGIGAANAVTVRRYSPAHVVAEVALGGRGLFVNRTPDGTWWRLRLRARRCNTTYPGNWGDSPPDCGVREPRRSPGPAPQSAAAELQVRGC